MQILRKEKSGLTVSLDIQGYQSTYRLVSGKRIRIQSRTYILGIQSTGIVGLHQRYLPGSRKQNCLSLIKNEADEEIQISAKSTNKFRYQANRAFIIATYR